MRSARVITKTFAAAKSSMMVTPLDQCSENLNLRTAGHRRMQALSGSYSGCSETSAGNRSQATSTS